MNSVLKRREQQQAADDRHAEQADARADDQARLHESDDDVRHDLAEHDLDRRDRHRQQAFHGAALDLARHRERGEDQHRHRQDGADQARNDVEVGRARRVVARMRADLERRRAAVGNGAVVPERGRHQLAERGERGAGRHRIGGVRRDQQRRPLAAPQRALEAGRDLDREQHHAGRQQPVELRLVADLVRDLEEPRVLKRRQNRTADVVRLLHQHRSRQVARRGVDGVAEQHELHQRDHDDHRERDAIAAKLDELLDQHRARTSPEAARPETAERAHIGGSWL